MRIAVLISGEYRTFGLCRKTMSFLDHPDIDIYFSTWDKTIYDMPKIGLHINEDVTIERIRKDLGKDATIEIEPHNLIIEERYNAKMIHRWKRGIELIKNSNIEYDFVLIIRPDLIFEPSVDNSFNFVEKYRDILAAGWGYQLDKNFLNDVILLSSYKKIIELFDTLTIDKWVASENGDWHTWWYSHAVVQIPDIEHFPEMSCCTFCRCWANSESTFADIVDFQHDWSDLKILQLADNSDMDTIDKHWPSGTSQRITDRWSSGWYKKYIKL